MSTVEKWLRGDYGHLSSSPVARVKKIIDLSDGSFTVQIRLLDSMLQLQNKQRNSMKHKLTVLICLIAIIGLGFYAKQIHHQYQIKETRAASVARSVQLKASEVANQREAQFQAGVAQDEAWCARDKLAYNILTPAAKLKAQVPDCQTNLIQ